MKNGRYILVRGAADRRPRRPSGERRRRSFEARARKPAYDSSSLELLPAPAPTAPKTATRSCG